MHMLNKRRRELYTVRIRVLFGARLADDVLGSITWEHWWAHLLANDGKWTPIQKASLRLKISDHHNNLFSYMGEGDDPDGIFKCFGFTSWQELYNGGFWPEGCFTKINEDEELRAAWLAECQWRNEGKPRRTIKTVLEEVLTN